MSALLVILSTISNSASAQKDGQDDFASGKWFNCMAHSFFVICTVISSNDIVGSTFYYIFYVVWYFGCFNVAAIIYGDSIDQSSIRTACMFGISTELTHTYTLNYSDVTFPKQA